MVHPEVVEPELEPDSQWEPSGSTAAAEDSNDQENNDGNYALRRPDPFSDDEEQELSDGEIVANVDSQISMKCQQHWKRNRSSSTANSGYNAIFRSYGKTRHRNNRKFLEIHKNANSNLAV